VVRLLTGSRNDNELGTYATGEYKSSGKLLSKISRRLSLVKNTANLSRTDRWPVHTRGQFQWQTLQYPASRCSGDKFHVNFRTGIERLSASRPHI